jgi:hypothetical protein
MMNGIGRFRKLLFVMCIRCDRRETVPRILSSASRSATRPLLCYTSTETRLQLIFGHSFVGLAYLHRLKYSEEVNLESAIMHNRKIWKNVSRAVEPVDWAHAHNIIAAAFRDCCKRGDRVETDKAAIAHAKNVLEVFSEQVCPIEWVQALVNIGTFVPAWRQRPSNISKIVVDSETAKFKSSESWAYANTSQPRCVSHIRPFGAAVSGCVC